MKKRKEESDLKKTESFNALGLSQEAINAIEEKGFVEPTPIPTALNPNADVNGDNIIDTRDVLEIMQNWYHIVPK